jgi:hypothetical protein
VKTARELKAGDIIWRRGDDNVRAVRLVRAVLAQDHVVFVMTTSVDRTDDDTTDVVTNDCSFTLVTS